MVSDFRSRHAPSNFMGLDPLYRSTVSRLQRAPGCTSFCLQAFSLKHGNSEALKLKPGNPPLLSGSNFQALIKNYVRLVNCPIYSVVKYRPRQPRLTYPPEQAWVLLTSDHARFRSSSNPIFDARLGWHPTSNWWFLVELTGIEPVASWLQTRRSPS